MNLNIPEAEYMKATEIILSDIEKILKKENIPYEYGSRYGSKVIKLKNITNNDKDIEIAAYSGGTFFNDLHSATITIYNTNYSKEIKVTYNNSHNYNSKDEQYVENLKITNPVYYEIELGESLYEAIEKYHANAVKDKTITFSVESAAGFGSILNTFISDGGVGLATFKNGVFYESKRIGYAFSIPVITVPSNIEDNKINDYVINVIRKYINENGKPYDKKWAAEITKIEKGLNLYNKHNSRYNVDIEDVYTVYSNATEVYYEENSFIIIRKDKNILNEDKTTNIKLNTNIDVVPANTILDCKLIKEEAAYNTVKTALKEVSEKFIAYDITLKSNGVKIQPNGKVQISIPVPEGYNLDKILVYRIAENGEKVKYDTEIEDNYIIFETDHFSTYVVAEEKIEEPSYNEGENEKDNTPQPDTKVENTQETDSNEKDDTPKTGVIDVVNYIVAIALISAIGSIVLKK
ncbi:MAG: hypothetical protein HFJ54_01370 [Clostridia bacterium]|nr:hypothetical protein [Clostridia bacterium]